MIYSISKEALALNTYLLRVHEGAHSEDAWRDKIPYVWSCVVVCGYDGSCEIKGIVSAPQNKSIIRALARFFVDHGRHKIIWRRANGKSVEWDAHRWAQ